MIGHIEHHMKPVVTLVTCTLFIWCLCTHIMDENKKIDRLLLLSREYVHESGIMLSWCTSRLCAYWDRCFFGLDLIVRIVIERLFSKSGNTGKEAGRNWMQEAEDWAQRGHHQQTMMTFLFVLSQPRGGGDGGACKRTHVVDNVIYLQLHMLEHKVADWI